MEMMAGCCSNAGETAELRKASSELTAHLGSPVGSRRDRVSGLCWVSVSCSSRPQCMLSREIVLAYAVLTSGERSRPSACPFEAR